MKNMKKVEMENVWAQSSAYPISGKTGENIGAEIGQFSDVQTDHCTPET
jgi:hypothetical protein